MPSISKRVLVTGAAGFIGSHLVELLVREGCNVRAFVHYNSYGRWPNLEQLPKDIQQSIEIFPGDVCDPRIVAQAISGCDWVFHLASLIAIPYSYLAPTSYVQTNVSGALNVLEGCRLHGVERVIHTSTSETYGSAQYVPIDERHPLVGQSPYSATKIGADKLAESFWLSFRTPVTILRPFNTYGPRQSQRALIPTIVSQALIGDTVNLGNLDPVRDLTFVTDTVRGFLAIARSPKTVGELINLGVGSGVSVRELVERIGRLLGHKLKIQQVPERARPEGSEVTRLISDNRKARSLANWTPQIDLDEGLQATIAHIRSYPDDYHVRGYVV